jgi:hypothetical protein
MVPLSSLWLPILLSSVFVWIASALAWTLLPHHKSDFHGLPDEEALRRALLETKTGPGLYPIPYCEGSKAMGSEETLKKLEEGPVGILTLRAPGKPSMGLPMALSFVYYLVVGVFVAYVTAVAVEPAPHQYLTVFRVAGTTAIVAYCGALIPRSVWFGHPWGATVKECLDGVVYGLLTAGTFGWLWPAA